MGAIWRTYSNGNGGIVCTCYVSLIASEVPVLSYSSSSIDCTVLLRVAAKGGVAVARLDGMMRSGRHDKSIAGPQNCDRHCDRDRP